MTTNDTKRQLLNGLLVISETVSRIHYGDAIQPVTWPHTPSNARAHVDGLVRSCVRDTHMLIGLMEDDDYRALSAFITQVESAWAKYDVAQRHYDPQYDSHELLNTGDPRSAMAAFCSLFTVSLRKIVPILRHQQDSGTDDLETDIPDGYFDDDIRAALRAIYSEAIRTYSMHCYISALCMCGKFLETILYDMVRVHCGVDAGKQCLGINAIVTKLHAAGLDLKHDVIAKAMDIITTHRNKAIHAGTFATPTADETKAVILLTKDVLTKAMLRARPKT